MGKKEKLITRLRSVPSDFTFQETVTLLSFFGYHLSLKGSTGGSRVIFQRDGGPSILLHRPHPDNKMKKYQLRQMLEFLNREGLL
ncbi:MAG: type II toxin-antitoxin system HicA family toxin [Erysipelotrichaceae bacterium]|nr:type II toxin-antitoxin system HicA family toxin [Erysipelotrichaceae bacterium]